MTQMAYRYVLQALAVFMLVILQTVAVAAEKPYQTDIPTLVIVSHPYPERSVMTRGMQQAADMVEGVTVRNLETLYV